MPNIRPILGCGSCMMVDGPAAIYSFPLEEDNGIPVCLIFEYPAHLIEVLNDILSLINESELVYRLQIFPFRTELHFEQLEYLELVMMCEILTSVAHYEVGDWCFLPSEMGTVLGC